MVSQDFIDWLYALSAPMVMLNKKNGAIFTSPYVFPDDTFIDLSENWEINSRETFLKQIFDLVDDGPAQFISQLYFKYSRFSEIEWLKYCEEQTDIQKIILKYVEQTFPACGVAGIRSWDYVRAAYLIRIGTTNKYVTEQEALWILNRISLRARCFYESWQHYHIGWFIGHRYRQTWGIEDLEQLHCQLTRTSQRHVMAELYTDKTLPYNLLPWFINIEELEKPTSLMEYDWS